MPIITPDDFTHAYVADAVYIFRYLRRATGVLDDALLEDIAQTAWLKAWEARDTFEGRNGCTIRSWVCKIAYNTYVMHTRKASVRAEIAQIDVDINMHAPSNALAHDTRIYVRQLLPLCSPAQARAVELVYLRGYALKEAAVIEHTTEQGIKLHLHRARYRMRSRSRYARTKSEITLTKEQKAQAMRDRQAKRAHA
jgi:RNA polymerase sigma factor (sigma-70 family)